MHPQPKTPSLGWAFLSPMTILNNNYQYIPLSCPSSSSWFPLDGSSASSASNFLLSSCSAYAKGCRLRVWHGVVVSYGKKFLRLVNIHRAVVRGGLQLVRTELAVESKVNSLLVICVSLLFIIERGTCASVFLWSPRSVILRHLLIKFGIILIIYLNANS